MHNHLFEFTQLYTSKYIKKYIFQNILTIFNKLDMPNILFNDDFGTI